MFWSISHFKLKIDTDSLKYSQQKKKNMKLGTKKSTFANNRQTIVSSNRKILLRAFIIFDCEIMNSVESKEMCLQEMFVWNGSMCNIDEILKMRSLFEMML